jgi:glycosyltransferase involved in cell wall biosynthesis
MTQRPTVSVIVPTRDRPELLRKTIAALDAQDYQGPIEVVVVFDKSEIDQDIESSHEGGDGDPPRVVKAITNVRKPGLAGGRNTGIEYVSGDYVAFCDDDDTWEVDKLRRQVDVLEAFQDVDMAVGALKVHFEGNITDRVPAMATITFADLLRSRIVEAHPSTFLFRHRLLDSIGLVDEDIPGSYAEDYEYLLRAARQTDIVVVRDAVVHVLWHTASFFVENWQTRIDALTYLLDLYPEFDGDPLGKARIEGQIAFAHAAMGNRRDARRWARQCLKHKPTERRAILAIAVSTGLVSAETVVARVQRYGRGI